MAAPRIRKLATPQGALGSTILQQLQGNDDEPIVIPWDEIKEELHELLRLLASTLAGIREWAAALPAAGAVALVALVVFCCCCCGYYAAVGRHGPRGPDGEEEEAHGPDGPVVRCGGRGGGGYRGGIFSLHPNKPFVS